MTIINSYYNGSLRKAVVHLYPDIGIIPKATNVNFWGSLASQKSFFEEIARERNMDALNAESWYSLDETELFGRRGGRTILNIYGGRLGQALSQVFPDVKFDLSKFGKKQVPETHQREIFEKFARAKGFDALIPENWYNVTPELLLPLPRASSTLKRFKYQVADALIHLFPYVPFVRDAFLPYDHWHSEANRREFFKQLARKKGIDPLSASDWISISPSITGADAVLTYYDGSLYKALLELFPMLDSSLLKSRPGNYWADARNQRNFFTEFAMANKFDPLVPENWYAFNTADIMKHKGAKSVMAHFDGSFATALLVLFPDISLDRSKFGTPRNYWKDVEHQKQFFASFAKSKGFDPLLPHYWYKLSTADYLALKTNSLLVTYGGSVVRALLYLFPDIGLDKAKFPKPKL